MHSTSENERFGKSCRLLTKKDYAQVFSVAKRCGHIGSLGSFKWFARRTDVTDPRLGIAVPKRWVKLSVHRNRLKRLVRESFRLNKNNTVGFDVVIIVRRSLNAESNTELARTLERIWQRISGLEK